MSEGVEVVRIVSGQGDGESENGGGDGTDPRPSVPRLTPKATRNRTASPVAAMNPEMAIWR